MKKQKSQKNNEPLVEKRTDFDDYNIIRVDKLPFPPVRYWLFSGTLSDAITSFETKKLGDIESIYVYQPLISGSLLSSGCLIAIVQGDLIESHFGVK